MKRIKFILFHFKNPNTIQPEACLADNENFLPNHVFSFKSSKQVVRVDETWFYLKHLVNHVKHVPNWPDFPSDTAQHKCHIPKVISLIAQRAS